MLAKVNLDWYFGAFGALLKVMDEKGREGAMMLRRSQSSQPWKATGRRRDKEVSCTLYKGKEVRLMPSDYSNWLTTDAAKISLEGEGGYGYGYGRVWVGG